MEITKREILASISIVAILFLVGFLISGKVSDYQMDQNEKYNTALKIQSQDIFDYGMRTNVGNAFVYGELKAVDPVTYPELSGDYMYVEKVKERYTQHTRRVAHTRTVNGKSQTYYTTETYWTWDRVGSEEKMCEELSFLNNIFASSKITIPYAEYVETIKESSRVRYKYYGVMTSYTGTLFTELKDGTISDRSDFYENRTIEETVEYLESNFPLYLFWICWIVLIGLCVYGFYYLDNRWLE